MDVLRTPVTTLQSASARNMEKPQFVLADIPRMMLRRKGLAGVVALVLSAIVVAVVLKLPTRFSAETSLLLDTRQNQVVDVQSILNNPLISPEEGIIRNELQILKSAPFARAVVERLRLFEEPEYQGSWLLQELDALPFMATLQEWWRHLTSPANSGVAMSPQDQAIENAITLYQRNVSINNESKASLVVIRARSRDPVLAARIANTHAQLYLEQQQDMLRASVERANTLIQGPVEALRQASEAADQDVQRFLAEHRIVPARSGTVISQQVSELNSQLTQARSTVAQLKARDFQLRSASIEGTLTQTEAASEIIGSPLIQRLREQEAMLTRRIAEIGERLGPGHPQMAELNNELRNLRLSLKEEMGRIISAVKSDLQAAEAHRAALEAELINLEQQNVTASMAETELHQLERRAEVHRQVYENFLARYRETSAQESLQIPIARVVSEARIPAKPYFPRRKRFIMAGMAASLMFGALIALLLELWRPGFRCSAEIEVLTGVPAFPSVPAVRRRPPERHVIDDPRSYYAEAIRSIKEQVRLAAEPNAMPKSILVCSALPQEGKSVLSVSLARSFALSGLRTVVVDGDLHRSSIDRLIAKRSHAAGLANVLGGSTGIEEVTYADPLSPLSYIPAGEVSINASELLNLAEIKGILTRLQLTYEVIILDSPPITAVADSLTIASLADATLIVVHWLKTPRAIVESTVDRLLRSGARIFGAVLNKVDPFRQTYFDRKDFEYYSRRNRSYYPTWSMAHLSAMEACSPSRRPPQSPPLGPARSTASAEAHGGSEGIEASPEEALSRPSAWRGRAARLFAFALGSAAAITVAGTYGMQQWPAVFELDRFLRLLVSHEPQPIHPAPSAPTLAERHAGLVATPSIARPSGIASSVAPSGVPEVPSPGMGVPPQPAAVLQPQAGPDEVSAATAAPPAPPEPGPGARTATPVSPPAPSIAGSLTPQQMIARGDALLSSNDVASARLFYQLAAAQGSPSAATMMGRTYDPFFQNESRLRGVHADPAKAAEWYRKAIEAGDPDALPQLQRLKENFRVRAH